MTPVRIGLVGFGFGGRYFHAPLIASAAECEFLGVVTTSAQRRREFSERFPGRAAFDSLEDLAAAGAEAVTISTPAATHVELTSARCGSGWPWCATSRSRSTPPRRERPRSSPAS